MEDHPDPSITQLYTIQDRLGKGVRGPPYNPVTADDACGSPLHTRLCFPRKRKQQPTP